VSVDKGGRLAVVVQLPKCRGRAQKLSSVGGSTTRTCQLSVPGSVPTDSVVSSLITLNPARRRHISMNRRMPSRSPPCTGICGNALGSGQAENVVQHLPVVAEPLGSVLTVLLQRAAARPRPVCENGDQALGGEFFAGHGHSGAPTSTRSAPVRIYAEDSSTAGGR
jgi:hypothetical protein